MNPEKRNWRGALAIIVLLLVVGFAFYSFSSKEQPSIDVETPSSNVKVDQGENKGGSIQALPRGFPAQIPVEINSVFESYRAEYQDQGVVQYTVSYTTTDKREAKWDEYRTFMIENGYQINESTSNRASGTISGLKDKDLLLVTISDSQEGKSTVRLNFIKR